MRIATIVVGEMILIFFFNDTATTEIYTLSLHDALPICLCAGSDQRGQCRCRSRRAEKVHLDGTPQVSASASRSRSEEHTSELQSRQYLVCRLLLDKKYGLVPRSR